MANILIIDDEEQFRNMLKRLLEEEGHHVLEACDGEEALDVAMKEYPDLIIMDIQLPKLNGLEVTRRLRYTPAFRHTPIVAITAYAMKGDKEKVIESGCDAYLSKPINTREFPAVIARMLQQRREDKFCTNGNG